MATFRRTISRAVPVQTPLQLTCRSASGRVRVTGRDLPTAVVRASVVVRGGSEAEAELVFADVEGKIHFAESLLSIESPPDEGDPFWRRLKIDYEVEVPTDTKAVIETAGRVELSRIAGPLELRAANGPVIVEDVAQQVEVNCTNGPVRLARCGSRLEITATNGPVSVVRAAGPADVHVTNGPVELTQIDAGVGARVLNGPINYRGSIGGDFDLECTNGGINLRVPRTGRFEIDAEAALGSVHSELPVHQEPSGNAPAPKVRLRTRSGSIHLRDDG